MSGLVEQLVRFGALVGLAEQAIPDIVARGLDEQLDDAARACDPLAALVDAHRRYPEALSAHTDRLLHEIWRRADRGAAAQLADALTARWRGRSQPPRQTSPMRCAEGSPTPPRSPVT